MVYTSEMYFLGGKLARAGENFLETTRSRTKNLIFSFKSRYDYAILESHRIVLETCFSQAVKSYFIFKENLNKKYSVVTKIYFFEFWGGWTRAPI